MVVKIPRIVTTNDLYNVQNLPYFRLTFNLFQFSDLKFYAETSGRYVPAISDIYLRNAEKSTEWLPANDVIPEQMLELELNKVISDEDMEHLTCMGSAGIEFGNVGAGGKIVAVKFACCAKILSVV